MTDQTNGTDKMEILKTLTKLPFSKLLLIQESVLIWLLTISFIVLAFVCVGNGFIGSLPWLTVTLTGAWSAYGVSQAMYYNKSKAENTKGGIVYETVVKNIDAE